MRFAGALFSGFAGLILVWASDVAAPGRARARRAGRLFLRGGAVLFTRPLCGRPTRTRRAGLRCETPIGELRWGARGSNSYGLVRPPDPKSGASASSASPPPKFPGGCFLRAAPFQPSIERLGRVFPHVPLQSNEWRSCRSGGWTIRSRYPNSPGLPAMAWTSQKPCKEAGLFPIRNGNSAAAARLSIGGERKP